MTRENTLRLPAVLMEILVEFARRAELSLNDLVRSWLDDRVRVERDRLRGVGAPTFPLLDCAGDGSHYRKPGLIDEIAVRVAPIADVAVRRMVAGACLEARARGLLVVVMPEGGGFMVAAAHIDPVFGDPPDHVLSSVDDVVAAVSFLLGDASQSDHLLPCATNTP